MSIPIAICWQHVCVVKLPCLQQHDVGLKPNTSWQFLLLGGLGKQF